MENNQENQYVNNQSTNYMNAKMKRTESWISPGGGIRRATKARMMPKVRSTMAVSSLSEAPSRPHPFF